MSILKTLEASKEVKVERKTTKKKELTIERMRDKIDSILSHSYAYVGRTAVDPIISVESINTISELIVDIERKMNKTILPSSLSTISELCSAVQTSRYNDEYDDETYVALLKQYVNYLIEKKIYQNN